MAINYYSEKDFQGMRAAGNLAARVLDYITDYIKPGVSTNYLNDLCHKMIIDSKAIPAPLNYKGFPKSICTSKNSVVCHGIPDDSLLRDGDIINIDVTVILDGWHGDTSRMYFVGKPSLKARRLCDATYNSMMSGINVIKHGVFLHDIGAAINDCADEYNFSVVKEYCGHGLGRSFHEKPSVLNYRHKDSVILKEGMCITVEPMLNAGDGGTILSKKDGWTVTTRDMSLSAQFEHSIGVTKDGYEIFTKSPSGMDKPPY